MEGTISQVARPKYYFKNEISEYRKTECKKVAIVLQSGFKAPKQSLDIVNNFSVGEMKKECEREKNIGIQMGVSTAVSSITAVESASTINGYNEQTLKYLGAIVEKQRILNQSNRRFLMKINEEQPKITTMRNKGDWTRVKQLVIREELMKLQIGEVTDLPLTENDKNILREQIVEKDLADFSDTEITKLIKGILKPDERQCLQAFKLFKETGVASPYFQAKKLDELSQYLEEIDLDKITAKQLKKLMDNYWERIEIHHKTSISQNAKRQNNIDNLETLNSSGHDAKHTDKAGKINYRKPLKEHLLNRQAELQRLNKSRTVKSELKGIGITLAVAAGTGFTIGFIVSMAKTGIAPNCLKHAFVAGGQSSAESSITALMGYGISKVVGDKLGFSLSEIIASKVGEKLGEEMLKNICTMCTMGVVGALTIMVTSVYQFVKLKMQGFSTKESLIRVGKSAALSFGVLALAILAQGIWGGPAGVTVSVIAGIVVTGVGVVKIIGDREVRNKIRLYLIELSFPKAFGTVSV